MSEVWFEERDFLNKKGFHSSAFIIGYIRTNPKNTWIETDLIISDCGEQIHLSIDCHSPLARQNTLYKLGKIIEVCQKMAGWIEENGATLDNLVKQSRIENRARPQRVLLEAEIDSDY